MGWSSSCRRQCHAPQSGPIKESRVQRRWAFLLRWSSSRAFIDNSRCFADSCICFNITNYFLGKFTAKYLFPSFREFPFCILGLMDLSNPKLFSLSKWLAFPIKTRVCWIISKTADAGIGPSSLSRPCSWIWDYRPHNGPVALRRVFWTCFHSPSCERFNFSFQDTKVLIHISRWGCYWHLWFGVSF